MRPRNENFYCFYCILIVNVFDQSFLGLCWMCSTLPPVLARPFLDFIFIFLFASLYCFLFFILSSLTVPLFLKWSFLPNSYESDLLCAPPFLCSSSLSMTTSSSCSFCYCFSFYFSFLSLWSPFWECIKVSSLIFYCDFSLLSAYIFSILCCAFSLSSIKLSPPALLLLVLLPFLFFFYFWFYCYYCLAYLASCSNCSLEMCL